MTEVQIRLDRSRPFSTCHGERTPDDPLYRVHFWQGGLMGGHRVLLPFDAHGNLVPDDGQTGLKAGLDNEGKKVDFHPLFTQRMKDYLAAKLRKAQPAATSEAAPTVIKEDGERDEEDDLSVAPDDDVNLEAWLRGTAEYPPHKLRDAYARRYHKRTEKIRDIFIDLLLDEKLIPEDQVSPALAKRFMPPKEIAA